MKVYSPSEAAELLGIKTATLRKYSLLLESNGYEIPRNSKRHRYYRDKDVMTIRNVITGSNNGATLEESVKNVVNLEGHSNESNVTNNAQEPNNNDIQELKEMINKQSELILSLTSRLDQQNEYIDKQVEFKLNEAIEKTKEIESPEFEQPKEIEAPKEIQTLKNSKVYPSKKISEIEEASTEENSAKGIETDSEIERQKEYDVFFKGSSETVEIPKENESSKLEETKLSADPETEEAPKESPSRRSKKDKEKGFFTKLLDKLIIDTRDNK